MYVYSLWFYVSCLLSQQFSLFSIEEHIFKIYFTYSIQQSLKSTRILHYYNGKGSCSSEMYGSEALAK